MLRIFIEFGIEIGLQLNYKFQLDNTK